VATYWAHRPHIRLDDPCFFCGVPMVPASREWVSFTMPPGHRRHGSLGLCQRCYRQYQAGRLLEVNGGLVAVR